MQFIHQGSRNHSVETVCLPLSPIFKIRNVANIAIQTFLLLACEPKALELLPYPMFTFIKMSIPWPNYYGFFLEEKPKFGACEC